MGKSPEKAPPKKVKLIDLPKILREGHGLSVNYNTLYSASVNGTIPAERNAAGTRWLVDESQIPKIIANFSLLKEPNA